MHVEPYGAEHLWSLRALVNRHLGAVVPGWALPEEVIARHLERDPTQPVTDPWVAERATLCAVDGDTVVAVAHLLRYRDDPDVGKDYRGAGEIGWYLFLPAHGDAAGEVLRGARERLAAWGVAREYGWGPGLPVGPLTGVPDVWPHVEAALLEAGYAPDPDRREALYGGPLAGVPEPGEQPPAGVELRRAVDSFGTRFSATVAADLTRAGELPALRGWGELFEIEVHEGRRNMGIGGWLVRHAAAWLRLAGCDRVVLATAAEDEARGAGRFYRRFGWDVLTREQTLWTHPGDDERP